MPGVKFMVLYPRPADIEAFEKIYQEEHVPMAVKNLVGKTKLVATKVVASPEGVPPFYRIAEIHFPSMEALGACAATAETQATLAHAVKRQADLHDRGRTDVYFLARGIAWHWQHCSLPSW